MKLAFLIAGCLCCGACGDRPHALGVTTNSVRITRALLEPWHSAQAGMSRPAIPMCE